MKLRVRQRGLMVLLAIRDLVDGGLDYIYPVCIN